jgi:hypothetical protein
MRILLMTILVLLSWVQQAVSGPVHILDITEQEGDISASFSLTGTTVLPDASGQPQVSTVDRLQAVLRITTPETCTVTVPQFHNKTFGDFTLIDQGRTDRHRTGSTITITTSWLIEPYNSGGYSLPPLIIKATAQENISTLTLNLPEIKVTAPAAADSFDLLPARPVAKNRLWLILAVTAGIITVIFILVLCLKGKKRPSPLTPKQQALLRLDKLDGTAKEKTKALSLLIRQFLDHNFNLCTVEKTYLEYKPFIKKHPLINQDEIILRILKTCDQSNYSNTPVSAEEITDITEQTRDFIKNCAEPLRPDEDTCGRW